MLAEELEAVLGRRPGLTAPELADLMGMGPGPGLRSVAFALYAGHGRFRCDGAEPPRWWLAGEGGAGPGGHGPLVGTPLWRNSGCSSEDPAPTPAGGPQGPSPSSPLALWPWQAEALGAWSRAGGRGVVEAVTGTGKTRLGVAAALQEIGRRGQVLVLVPTVELQHQWVGELAARLPPGSLVGRLGAGGADTLLTHDVVVAVVNSARDLDVRPIRRGGLLVADECHRYGSEVNRLALDGRFARRLGLSATYARDDDGHLAWLDPYFGPTCFRMGYKRAVAEGVTARFRVAFVGVRLSEVEQCLYDELSDEISKLWFRLTTVHGLPAEPFEAFIRAVNLLADGFGDSGGAGSGAGSGSGVARRYRAALLERRRLLADTPAKAEALAGLAPAVAGADRAIVFTQSIAASEEACARLAACNLRAGVIHSAMGGEDRRAVLGRFASGGLDVICAPRVLDEGVDVPAADLAVIVGASRSRRQMIQRMGRVLRRKADGRPARFAVLFVEGSVEDPERGAHETFVEEVTGVADEVCRLSAELVRRDPGQACDLLAWHTGAG